MVGGGREREVSLRGNGGAKKSTAKPFFCSRESG